MPRRASKTTDTTERKTKEKGNGQGSVYELPDGRYRWMITLGYRLDGKRITASGRAPNKRAAQNAMTQALADHQRGLLAAPDSITVAEYLNTLNVGSPGKSTWEHAPSNCTETNSPMPSNTSGKCACGT